MKLLTKTSLLVATLSVFLFFLTGIIFFQVLKTTGIRDLKDELRLLRNSVEEYLPVIVEEEMYHLPGLDSISVVQKNADAEIPVTFRDTSILQRHSGVYELFQVYTFPAEYMGQTFQVELYKSTTSTDKLVERVTLLMTLMVILFLTGLFILNRLIFSNLWKDFFSTLDRLKSFHLTHEAIPAKTSDIREFNELNHVLEKLTIRLSKDFLKLREYTDNTMHELQTPLSVIKAKTELLLQSENLKESDAMIIRDIYRNADHLSRLNATLAMITRIENQQYTDKEMIEMPKLIDQHLNVFEDLIRLKNIHIRKHYQKESIVVFMHQGLADVLIINLLKNAIVHNIEDGDLHIELTENRLMISNTGDEKELDPEMIFRRFYQGKKQTNSFGLGLSLVKNICDYYGYEIHYNYENKMHTFILNF